MKVSFDFDGTLERKIIQEYAKELVDKGIEVWIVTSRYDDTHLKEKFQMTIQFARMGNRDLYEVAEEVGIPEERIHFTNYVEKWRFLKDKDFIWHIDDDWVENRQILNNTKTKAINCYGTPSWKNKCERILRKYKERD